jgi:hypothetical protein
MNTIYLNKPLLTINNVDNMWKKNNIISRFFLEHISKKHYKQLIINVLKLLCAKK